jgi:hypothetical protein
LKYSKTINGLILFLAFSSLTISQDKDYDIYLYDSINGMRLSIDNESLSVKALNFGKFLLEEDLEYEEQTLDSENNLFNKLLLKSKIDIVDAQWEESIDLLDDQKVKIRFLYAEEDTLSINDDEKIALLYRLDIKSEEKKVSDTINSLNLAIIESSIIKIWIDEESSSLIKLSLMYNGIVYSIK